MSDRPPIVSSSGDINVHALEDIEIPLLSSGASFAGLPMFFEIVDTDVSVALLAHPTDPTGRLIKVTPDDLVGIGTVTQFAVVERDATNRRVRWSGRLTRYA